MGYLYINHYDGNVTFFRLRSIIFKSNMVVAIAKLYTYTDKVMDMDIMYTIIASTKLLIIVEQQFNKNKNNDSKR